MGILGWQDQGHSYPGVSADRALRCSQKWKFQSHPSRKMGGQTEESLGPEFLKLHKNFTGYGRLKEQQPSGRAWYGAGNATRQDAQTRVKQGEQNV